MSNTLYRKYRPKKFDELIGQNHVKITLENQIASDNIAHAYLFTGPRGVGKTTTARLLAAAVNVGENEDIEGILKGRDIDVIEIDAASNSGVENVRENIIENSRFTPNIRKYKVFIIDEVHMLSISAFNALLKILEEPPSNTLFILATTELHKLPATIVSRCQRFDFKKIHSKDIVERLRLLSKQEGVEVEDSVFYDIARHSEGCLRDAESLLGQVLAMGEKKITQDLASIILPSSHFGQVLELLKYIGEQNASQAIIYINENLTQGVDINQFFIDFLEILRKILISKITKNLNHYSFELSDDLEKNIIESSNLFTQNQLLRMIDIFAKKRLELKNTILPQLPLELAVVEYIESQNKQILTQSSEVKKKLLIPKTQPEVKDEVAPELLVEEEKTTNEKEESKDNSFDENINIELVKEKWTVFLSELQKGNPSLVLILKNAEPADLIEGVLRIGYKYSFHKDKIMNGDLYDVLLNTFNTFIGKVKKIEGFVLSPGHVSEFIQDMTADDEVEFIADTSIPDNTTSIAEPQESENVNQEENKEDLLNNLVQAFGGKIVE